MLKTEGCPLSGACFKSSGVLQKQTIAINRQQLTESCWLVIWDLDMLIMPKTQVGGFVFLLKKIIKEIMIWSSFSRFPVNLNISAHI